MYTNLLENMPKLNRKSTNSTSKLEQKRVLSKIDAEIESKCTIN